MMMIIIINGSKRNRMGGTDWINQAQEREQ
jgi:hypothetical protein